MREGLLESSYLWEVWRRKRRVVFIGGERGAWDWVVESNEGLGSYEN